MLQDAFLRWAATDRASIDEPAAWLTTTVTNLCLTFLGSARQRRESYVGTWLPEPVLTGSGALGPLETTEQRESVSMALLLLCERLTAPERAVFILHEAFGYRYGEIGLILDRSEAACRQLGHRAAERISGERLGASISLGAPDPAGATRWRRLIDQFLNAAAAGDVAGLEQVLSEDVVSWSDGGGKFPAGLRPVLGRAKVARLFAALVPKMLPGGPTTGGLVHATAGIRHAGIELSAAEVNGSAAMLAWSGGILIAAIIPEIGPDGITALYTIANPDKLVFTARQAAGLPRSSALTPSRNADLSGQ
jgi:DNA-directed RNA polymerase specialized sigma24 family protein